jgi:hypothetical protein
MKVTSLMSTENRWKRPGIGRQPSLFAHRFRVLALEACVVMRDRATTDLVFTDATAAARDDAMYKHLLVALEVARFLRAPQHRQQQFAIELGVA